ncbi:shikimate kinase [Ornithobacterium rhinotracheale]|uniref:shikimate kinase n=1 Tax=Ornithobacterium rhinotracheale TaxID=28251 RepID=UPI00129C74D8|nr:shikimate kinase [Ornithobacterium rhinotracheale]MRJ08257.1 shikimate kinase [Ornithobacterium rhinotracheale]UOH77452.1 AAA family ATPase [Ornithobacterium rhinotracheale]
MLISLVGYMGSGKTSVASALSQKLQCRWADLDHEIENFEKIKISEIFKQKGEIYFRKLENQLLEKLLQSPEPMVLSLGGGAPMFYNNMELLLAHSESFYLFASPAELATRLAKGKAQRPLIQHLSDEELPEFIAKHLFERNPKYQMAKYTINTQGLSPDGVADEIIQKLNLD